MTLVLLALWLFARLASTFSCWDLTSGGGDGGGYGGGDGGGVVVVVVVVVVVGGGVVGGGGGVGVVVVVSIGVVEIYVAYRFHAFLCPLLCLQHNLF